MKKFKQFTDVSENFTGIAEILSIDEIIYFENGKIHNENGPAVLSSGNQRGWFYKNEFHGVNDDFTNETWIEKVEYLKREEEFKIFI